MAIFVPDGRDGGHWVDFAKVLEKASKGLVDAEDMASRGDCLGSSKPGKGSGRYD